MKGDTNRRKKGHRFSSRNQPSKRGVCPSMPLNSDISGKLNEH